MRRYGSSSQIVFGTLTVLLLAATAAPIEAQSVRDRIKAKAAQRINQKVDQAIDRGLDAVECVVTDMACIESAQASGKDVVVTDTDGNPVSKPSGKPSEGVWLNYDFTPGDRVLFYSDFMDDEVGDFPRGFDLMEGNVEVAEKGGVRYLRHTGAEVEIKLPETLPERFTLEFDFVSPGNNTSYIVLAEGAPGRITIGASDAAEGGAGGIEAGARNFVGHAPEAQVHQAFPVRVMADGEHVKVYLGSTRVANVPSAQLGRSDRIRLILRDWEPAMITNVRVAAGGKDLYDALSEGGRVATQGILFDVGSDRIRPESTPTLKEIGAMLKKHGDLKLVIEGHTDSAGDDAANQNLSERRAAAVRAHLVEKYEVDADRLEAKGMGESSPVAPNETPEGRQQNRRVELVRR